MISVDAVSVVVIENQPLMLAALSAALLTAGMKVLAEVGESGQAIQAAQRFKPQVILFSVSGIADMERVSALRHEFPDVKILALVNGDYRGQERVALDYGAHHVISKAASRAELVKAVRELTRIFPPFNRTVNMEARQGM